MSDLERYRPLARAIARRYYLPDGEPEDLEQEAMIGLLAAQRDYRPERGSFASFARLCIERQVVTAVKTATRQKHRGFLEARRGEVVVEGEILDLFDVIPDPRADIVELATVRERLRAIRLALPHLTAIERAAAPAAVDGDPWPAGKTEQAKRWNAWERGRRKLRAAA